MNECHIESGVDLGFFCEREMNFLVSKGSFYKLGNNGGIIFLL